MKSRVKNLLIFLKRSASKLHVMPLFLSKDRFSIQTMIEHPRHLSNRLDYFSLTCLSIASVALFTLGVRSCMHSEIVNTTIAIYASMSFPILMAAIHTDGRLEEKLKSARENLLESPKCICQSIVLGTAGLVFGSRVIEDINHTYNQEILKSFKYFVLCHHLELEAKLKKQHRNY